MPATIPVYVNINTEAIPIEGIVISTIIFDEHREIGIVLCINCLFLFNNPLGLMKYEGFLLSVLWCEGHAKQILVHE